jgi:hypothetical protein
MVCSSRPTYRSGGASSLTALTDLLASATTGALGSRDATRPTRPEVGENEAD